MPLHPTCSFMTRTGTVFAQGDKTLYMPVRLVSADHLLRICLGSRLRMLHITRRHENIWSVISNVVTVLGRPRRGASQVEKSLRWNWATQFLTMAYDGACPPDVSIRMAWISFGALPCRKRKKRTWQLASRCCWNRALRVTCFLSASVTRKDLQFGTWTDPSFRHYRFRVVDRAKDLPAPSRKNCLYRLLPTGCMSVGETDWLISIWVRALSVPMHLGLNVTGP